MGSKRRRKKDQLVGLEEDLCFKVPWGMGFRDLEAFNLPLLAKHSLDLVVPVQFR